MKARSLAWTPPSLPLTKTRGVLKKYSLQVSSAHYGALTDGSHCETYDKPWVFP